MQFYKCALFCAILALSILDPTTARKGYSSGGSRHSYPKPSSGLSGGGGGHHGYPSSGGLSGGGHGYPSSGGSHSYPSSGNSHGYPASGGLSGNNPGRGGYPSSGGNHAYPSSGGNHGYPSSGGSHGYPASGGLSGNNNRGSAGSTTNIHHHYHYNPPQSIAYTSNGRRVEYPVYHGTPPTYVYKYKDSGSKYGTLLTGLALLNLGALAGTAYAVSQSHGHSGSSGGNYKAQPGEVCKFGLKTKTSTEETRIDCHLILNFILAEQKKNESAQQNRTIITSSTTVTNVTIVNNTNPVAVEETTTPKILYEQLPNGTFVAVTSIPVNTTEPPPTNAANGSNPIQQSVVTTMTNTTTVVDALDVKGKPVEVTPDMLCYVIRTTPTTYMKKDVPCQLLQTYADKSIQRNSASRSLPTFAIFTAILAAFVLN